jgi:hypothetical protein
MIRRCAAIIGSLLVVLLAAVMTVHFYKGRGNDSPTANATAPAVSSAVPSVRPTTMPAADAKSLEQKVNSSSKKSQAEALASDVRDAFLDSGKSLHPKGVTFQIQTGTFVQNQNAAAVLASSSDGKKYVLHLVRTRSTTPWLILYTEEIK